MTEQNKSHNFQTQLLQQESSLLHPLYKEHRMQLEAKLAQAERHLKLTKQVGVVAILLAAGLLPIVLTRPFGGNDPYDKDATLISVSLAILYGIAGITATICIASYYSRFLPQARQVREDLQDEMLRELRSDLAELREQFAQSRHTPQ